MNTLYQLSSPELQLLHRGKVRDSFRIDPQTRMLVVTDRISAFNQKIKTPIPDKGAVLNQLSNWWFEQTAHIIPNHVLRQIHPNVTLVKEAQPIRVEVVVRGYLTGSMWRGYEQGKRNFSGLVVDDNLQKNQRFDTPILTPTTKDEDDTEISEAGIIEAGLVSTDILQAVQRKAMELYSFASVYLAERGLILVDTKYEFGLDEKDELLLIDEVHTPDSSRYWRAADYKKDPQTVEQLDKEFVRQWLLANQQDGQTPDALPEEVVAETADRYRTIYQEVTGHPFAAPTAPLKETLHTALERENILSKTAELRLT